MRRCRVTKYQTQTPSQGIWLSWNREQNSSENKSQRTAKLSSESLVPLQVGPIRPGAGAPLRLIPLTISHRCTSSPARTQAVPWWTKIKRQTPEVKCAEPLHYPHLSGHLLAPEMVHPGWEEGLRTDGLSFTTGSAPALESGSTVAPSLGLSSLASGTGEVIGTSYLRFLTHPPPTSPGTLGCNSRKGHQEREDLRGAYGWQGREVEPREGRAGISRPGGTPRTHPLLARHHIQKTRRLSQSGTSRKWGGHGRIPPPSMKFV